MVGPVDESVHGDIDDFREGQIDQERGGLEVFDEKRGRAGDGEFDASVVQQTLLAERRVELGGVGFQSQKNPDGLGHGADRGGDAFEILKDGEGLGPEVGGIGVEVFRRENMGGDGFELRAIREGAATHIQGFEEEARGIDESHRLATRVFQ